MLSAERPFRVTKERQQERVVPSCQADPSAIQRCQTASAAIEVPVTEPTGSATDIPLLSNAAHPTAAHNCSDTRNQLTKAIWLSNIVVSTGLQDPNPLGLAIRVTYSNHCKRSDARPVPAQEIDPIGSACRDVHDDHI